MYLQLYRESLGGRPRAPSPTDHFDDSVDDTTLDPELASIAQRVHTNANLRGQTPHADVGGPPEVQLKVFWKPHPLNPQGKSQIWGFKQKRVCARWSQLFVNIMLTQ